MSDFEKQDVGLLVSVRSAAEAVAALEGGASLIDIKEPDHGPLGRASNAVVAEVVAAVAGRRPVSAALGELLEDRGESPPPGLAFVKWGLAGAGASATWCAALDARRSFGPEVVAVAYADWRCARAPSVDRVFQFAACRAGSVLLLDTHCKDAPSRGGSRPTLLDWLTNAEIVELCENCRAAEVSVALAGSLGPAEIRGLAPARPNWFAVRGAACDGGRGGRVRAARVHELTCVIRQACTRRCGG
jgi:uncharacterized protein (UPF0264 family)